MNERPAPAGGVPTWDVADRMRKALREAGLGVQEMADYLGVTRSTVSTWINGRIEPSTQTLRLWSLRCGVPFEWLAGDRDPRVRGGRNRATGAPEVGFKSERLTFPLVTLLTLAAA